MKGLYVCTAERISSGYRVVWFVKKKKLTDIHSRSFTIMKGDPDGTQAKRKAQDFIDFIRTNAHEPSKIKLPRDSRLGNPKDAAFIRWCNKHGGAWVVKWTVWDLEAEKKRHKTKRFSVQKLIQSCVELPVEAAVKLSWDAAVTCLFYEGFINEEAREAALRVAAA